MKKNPETVGILYVDGHVRVYHGYLTKLPRRFVSRERLCLRGTTDYWVNDAVGRPFFVVEKAVDPGLLKTLEEDIIPRLLQEIPNPPDEDTLARNPHRCRFILVFDREGYSPGFYLRMWKNHRIACLTYHKHPGANWPEQWFFEHEVSMPGGQLIKLRLAEMGTLVGSGKEAVWMKETRKLTESGHQTSVISTAYELPGPRLAASMFTRWCQENFFRYMMEHFALDLLSEYGTEKFPDTEPVVNPDWREQERTRNQVQNKLRYRRAAFAELTLRPDAENDQARYRKWLIQKADILEQVQLYERQLIEVKSKLKEIPKHITWGELPDQEKFRRLPSGRKRLLDTIRMISYRAETAMVNLMRSPTVDSCMARKIMQELFVTEADILPDKVHNLLHIRVHSASRPAMNRELRVLFRQLNQEVVHYPGTELRLVFSLVGEEPAADFVSS